MYSDPSQIRSHAVRVNFNEIEKKLINSVVEYTGQQRAVLIREMILEQARLVLSGQADYEPTRAVNEEAKQHRVNNL